MAGALVLLRMAAAGFALALLPSGNAMSLRPSDLAPIAGIVGAEIEAGRIPGAVVEIGQGEAVVYRGAFGYRELEPRRVAIRPARSSISPR